MQKTYILLERGLEAIHARLARRAEAMLDAGLIEEVTHLRTLGIRKKSQCRQRHWLSRKPRLFLRGDLEESDLLATIIKNTKALVKKQKDWFRTQLPEADRCQIWTDCRVW